MAALSPLLDVLRLRCLEIDARWRDIGFDYSNFPALVQDVIGDLDLTPFGRIEETIQLLADPDVADLQRLSSFSDLYVKLFDNGRFWIEVLNWWGSDINIHDHDFAGVQFQLAGQSLNVDYEFVEEAQHDGLAAGELMVSSAKLWRPGDRSVVEPGRKAPHNVCHIDIPTVSLLIRTHPDPAFGPQWNYFPPGIAGSYGVATPSFRKHVQALRLLARDSRNDFRRAFNRFCETRTKRELLFGLVKMIDFLFDVDKVDLVRELAERSFEDGAIVEALVFHRAIESIKHYKNTRALPWKTQLALSIAASGTNSRQLEQIVGLLRKGGFDPGFDNPVEQIRSASAGSVGSHIANALAIFDVAA